MSRKMIFFDIDGTIAAEGSHHIPKSTAEAIYLARANGHLTFINTGRTRFNIEPELEALGFDGYVCGCGTYIYVGDTCLLSHHVSHERALEIIWLLRDCYISALFEENSRSFFDQESPENKMRDNLIARFGMKDIDVQMDIEDENLVFDKLVVWLNTRSDYRTFFAEIGKDFDIIDRGASMYEIVPKGFSKATGIQFLMDHFQIPAEDCYAVGDSTNDLSMLQFVPNSIAMGNSMKEILPYCAYQTADLEDDGIYKAMRHYGII